MRDYRKLRTFTLADELIVPVYVATKALPPEERYTLQSQIRRAALSSATNIVEGSARRTTREYAQFLTTAFASSVECGYLLGVASRLGYLNATTVGGLCERYDHLIRMLNLQIEAMEDTGQAAPRKSPREP